MFDDLKIKVPKAARNGLESFSLIAIRKPEI